jgi:hypothetical protein
MRRPAKQPFVASKESQEEVSERAWNSQAGMGEDYKCPGTG